MVNTLTKEDFAKYVDIPANLPVSKLTRFISDAAVFDLEPALNSGKLYNALIESIITPYSALDDFFQKFVKPYWVYCAFCNFELRHGVDVTQAGMKVHLAQDSENVTDKRRSELLSDDRSKANVWKSKLLKELELQSRTFDSEYYQSDEVKPQKQSGNGWQIRSVAPRNGILGNNCDDRNYLDRAYNNGSTGGKTDYNEGDYN